MQQPTPQLRRVFRACDPQSMLSTRALGKLIAEVPGLSVRLETYIKSFYSWLGGDMSDPTRAAAVLGPRVIGSVAVQHALVAGAEDSELSDAFMSNFWSDCLRRGVAARLLCEHVDEAQPDMAFTVGMLLEFGLIDLLERQGQHLKWFQTVRPLLDQQRVNGEIRLFGCSHLSAFDSLARDWELPVELLAVIQAVHGDSEVDNAELAPLVTVAHWADSLGEALTTSASGPALEDWVTRIGFELRLREDSAWKLIAHVLKQTNALAPSLGLVVCEQPEVDELRRCRDVSRDPRALGHSELVQWALMLQESNEMLEQRVEELDGVVDMLQNRDALTQLSTHATFLKRLEREVVQARKSGRNFCAILVDLDGFTEINVQHGFQVGDEFLRQVSNIFQRQLRDAVEVARVGPDSFAAIIGGDERTGRLAAERIRAGVEALRIDIDRQRVRVTCKVTGVVFSGLSDNAGYRNMYAELYKLRAANAGANRTYWKESY
jgi:diguanylate cyclase (GGDEF)-like protein